MVAIKFKYEGAIKRVTMEREQVVWVLLLDTLKQIYSITSVEFLVCTFHFGDELIPVRSESDFQSITPRLQSSTLVICDLEQRLTLHDLLDRLLQIPSNAELTKGIFARYSQQNPRFRLQDFLSEQHAAPSLSLTVSQIHAESTKMRVSGSQFRLVMHTENGKQVLKAVPAREFTDYANVRPEDLRASLPPRVVEQVSAPIHVDPRPAESSDILNAIGSEESEGSEVDADPLEADKRLLMDHDSDDDLELLAD